MSIFLEIIKAFIVPELKSVRDKSVKADASATNTALGWIGMGRDTELSDAKKAIIDEIWPRVQGFQLPSIVELWGYIQKMQPSLSPSSASAAASGQANGDRQICECLIALCEAARRKAAAESRLKSYDEGRFGPRMERAKAFVQAIFDKLQSYDLIDVPYDNDPLHLFKYHAAYYLAQKLDDARNASTFQRYMQHPQINTIQELAQRKEDLLKVILTKCDDDLDGLDKKNAKYLENRKARVKECIEALKRENGEICLEHGIKWDIPIHVVVGLAVNVGLPTLHPDSGFLEICMNNALHDIESRHADEEQASSSSAAGI